MKDPKKATPEQLARKQRKKLRHQHEMVKAEATREIRGRRGRRNKMHRPGLYERVMSLAGRSIETAEGTIGCEETNLN